MKNNERIIRNLSLVAHLIFALLGLGYNGLWYMCRESAYEASYRIEYDFLLLAVYVFLLFIDYTVLNRLIKTNTVLRETYKRFILPDVIVFFASSMLYNYALFTSVASFLIFGSKNENNKEFIFAYTVSALVFVIFIFTRLKLFFKWKKTGEDRGRFCVLTPETTE